MPRKYNWGLDRYRIKNGYILLIECMFALIILLMVVSLVMPLYHKQRAENDACLYARVLAMHFQISRNYNMSSPPGQKSRFTFEKDGYTLSDCFPTYNGYYPCPQGIHIYWRNSKKVVFTMRGRVWGTETFELQDEQNKVQKKVVISSQTGRIRIE
ncbi:hypothetical protein [Megasphaera sp. UPII 135-E]|uniref:hypothetical protein n=1 Tax=Megasphaera sp. UPII 135-E TaxID=1000569 RepID=UPI00021A1B82|nr:hypothetical protein [Megasphaera sp. UPII 135-E]EGS34092.1 hypothetical protein HMPREF1040_0982 [Megasphaera sp. UPII 135-E]